MEGQGICPSPLETDANGTTTETVYDELNRPIAEKISVGGVLKVTSFNYDANGNQTNITDWKGNTSTFFYDSLNRLIEKKDALDVSIQKLEYTHNNMQVKSYDAFDNATYFSYDKNSRPLLTTDPEEHTNGQTYDSVGNIAAKIDGRSNVTAYAYDVFNRLTSVTNAKSEVTSYTWDANGNRLTMTDATGTTVYTYDEENRVTAKTVPGFGIFTFAYDLTQGYSAGAHAETSADPKGNVTIKVYDKAGRLASVTAGGQTTAYSYDNNGNRERVLYPDGSGETYTYYKDNLVKTLVNKKVDNTEIDSYAYVYDGAHNQTTKTDSKGATSYTYDVLNRLSSVSEPDGRLTSYTFDKAGNRIGETVVLGSTTITNTYQYNEQNRLLRTETHSGTETEKVSYAYDNNGNTLSKTKTHIKQAAPGTVPVFSLARATDSTSRDVTLLSYDVWNQLTKTVEGGKTSTYDYNGDGYRVSKTVAGVTTKYLYEADKVILETDEQGTQTAYNVYGTNLISRETGTDTAYYMYNGHGDVTALIDGTGTVLATYYYDAFGNILENNEHAGLVNPFRYAGYQYDTDTELYYLNARYYDSKIARFLTEDTYRGSAGDPLSLNLYTYCYNNPVLCFLRGINNKRKYFKQQQIGIERPRPKTLNMVFVVFLMGLDLCQT